MNFFTDNDNTLVNEANGTYKKIPFDYENLQVSWKLAFFNTIAPYTKAFYSGWISPVPASIYDFTTLPNWQSFIQLFLFRD